MEELDVYELAILLSERCTQEELVSFCAAMKVNHENVMGVADTLLTSALKLTRHFQARDKLGALWQEIRRVRPDLANTVLAPKTFQQLFTQECQQLKKDVLFEYYDELLSLFIENPDTVIYEKTRDVKPEFTPIQAHLKKKLDHLITEAENDKHKFYYLKAKLQYSVGNLDSCRRILHNHCTNPDESKYSELMFKCLCESIGETCKKDRFDENDKVLTTEWLGNAETILIALNLDEESDEYKSLKILKATLHNKATELEEEISERERANQLRERSTQLARDVKEARDASQLHYDRASRFSDIELANKAIEECNKFLGLLDEAEEDVLEDFPENTEFYKNGRRLLKKSLDLKTQLEREKNDE